MSDQPNQNDLGYLFTMKLVYQNPKPRKERNISKQALVEDFSNKESDLCYNYLSSIRGSSMVEQPAVNRWVVGSSPTRGANTPPGVYCL